MHLSKLFSFTEPLLADHETQHLNCNT